MTLENVRQFNDVAAVGVLCLLLVLATCGLSWLAVRCIQKNMREWWWLVAWAAHRTRRGSAAKTALRKAIEQDEKGAGNEDPRTEDR